MRKPAAGIVAGLSTAALTLAFAAPAHAELYGVDDADDSPHGSDLYAASIRHTVDNLVVVTTHDNLTRHGTSGGKIFIDTDRSDRGPEYVLVGGFFDGTDYALLETEGFAPSSFGDRVEGGDYRQVVRYRADKVRTRISTGTLGDPDEVRVAIRVSGHGKKTVDWLGAPHQWTKWIARG